MERTARVVILALLFQLYPRIDQIDDVGSGKQIVNKYTWNSSSHMPQKFLMTYKRKQAAHSFRKHGLTTTTRSELRAVGPQQISTDEYGVRFREPVSSRDVSQQKL